MTFNVTAEVTISVPIPNGGTFVLPYPVGTNVNTNWANSGHILTDRAGNKYTTGLSVSFGASGITVTNSSLGTIGAGRIFRLQANRISTTTVVDFAFDASGNVTGFVKPDGSVLYQPNILARSAVAVSCPVDTSEDILATITVPANAMGPNGIVRVWTRWTVTNSANAKTFRVRFGGIGGTLYRSLTQTAIISFSDLVSWANVNAANSQKEQLVGVNLIGPFLATTNGIVTGAKDTTQAQDIVITGQKALGSETLTLESYLVELLYGA